MSAYGPLDPTPHQNVQLLVLLWPDAGGGARPWPNKLIDSMIPFINGDRFAIPQTNSLTRFTKRVLISHSLI